MYSNNSKLTESRSPPPLIAVGKMRPDLALQEINQARSQFKQLEDAREWNGCHLHSITTTRAQELQYIINTNMFIQLQSCPRF